MVEEGIEVKFKGDAGPLKTASDQAVDSIEKFSKAAAKGSAAAYDTRYAIIDLSHIFRDLPYAISNPQILAGPFDRMTEAIINTKSQLKEGQTLLATFAQSLTGSGGVMIALSLVTDALVFFGKDLFGSSNQVDTFKSSMERLNSTLDETKKRIEGIQSRLDFSNKLGSINNEIAHLNKSVDLGGQNISIDQALFDLEPEIDKLSRQKVDFQMAFEDIYNTDEVRAHAKEQMDAVGKTLEEALEKQSNLQKQRLLGSRKATLEHQKEDEDAEKQREEEAKKRLAAMLKEYRLEEEEYFRHLKEMARHKIDADRLLDVRPLAPDWQPNEGINATIMNRLRTIDTKRPQINYNVIDIEKSNKAAIEGIKNLTQMHDTLKIVEQEVRSGVTSAFESLFSAIAAGKNPMMAFFQSIERSVEQLIAKLIAAAIEAQFINALSGGTSSALGPASIHGIPLYSGPHAAGGIAYGPSMGLIGEYANAGSNPEVIAPLSKLKSLLGGVQGAQIGEIRISGNDLVLVTNRMNKTNGRTT